MYHIYSMKFLSRRTIAYSVLAVLFVWFICIVWPLRGLINVGFLTHTHLVVLTNESEARPCGGFVSAYGLVRAFPPKVHLFNAYTLDAYDLGPALPPIDQVAQRMKFWDIGTHANLEFCVDDFATAYRDISDNAFDQVILIPAQILTDLVGIFEPIDFQGQVLNQTNAFSTLSRSVANTDRHNVQALESRKDLMGPLVKTLFRKILLSPHKWTQVTRHIDSMIQSRQIYISGISPAQNHMADSFMLTEWNLGGGKASRLLQKEMSIFAQETSPNQWEITVTVDVFHPGGQDEPLSQDWTGILEIKPPAMLSSQRLFEKTIIPMGQTYTFGHVYGYQGDLTNISFLSPRGQQTFVDFTVSVFPQQYITSHNLNTTESVGTWRGVVGTDTQNLTWSALPDTTEPFATLHKPINLRDLSTTLQQTFADSDLVIEVHFSEKIVLAHSFLAQLIDQNTADDISQDLTATMQHLSPAGNVLLLGFVYTPFQPNESYTLQLNNIFDVFGNAISRQHYTVITRP